MFWFFQVLGGKTRTRAKTLEVFLYCMLGNHWTQVPEEAGVACAVQGHLSAWSQDFSAMCPPAGLRAHFGFWNQFCHRKCPALLLLPHLGLFWSHMALVLCVFPWEATGNMGTVIITPQSLHFWNYSSWIQSGNRKWTLLYEVLPDSSWAHVFHAGQACITF